MHHHHTHDEHPWCVATIVYNVLVVLIELALQIAFTEHDTHEVITVELRVQAFHFMGIISLGALQWWIIHRLKKQTTWKFAGVSLLMIAIHMIVLHVLPRVWGMSQLHDEHALTGELFVLMFVVVLVTVMFWYRDRVLDKLQLKNKWHLSRKRPFIWKKHL